MNTPTMNDAQFELELEIFRGEVESGIQFFYAFLTAHAVAAKNEAVFRLLNKTPLFWNTNLGALQTATFIALGRVFDQQSPHNLDKLLNAAQNNRQLFAKEALRLRKQARHSGSPEWLEYFLSNIYEPTPKDFRRLRSHVKKWRKAYQDNYRVIRHKLFAHKEIADRTEIDELFARINIREMQRMFISLSSLYEALWGLFVDGRKPVLRPQRYSVKRIRALPSPERQIKDVQELITYQTEQCLRLLTGNRQ